MEPRRARRFRWCPDSGGAADRELSMQGNARLAGKSALITGGGGGIGAATAALFCAQGASVMLVDANAEALSHAAAQIAQDQPQACVATFCADVSDPQQIGRAPV